MNEPIESFEQLQYLLSQHVQCFAEPVGRQHWSTLPMPVMACRDGAVKVGHWKPVWLRFDDPSVRWHAVAPPAASTATWPAPSLAGPDQWHWRPR